MAPRLQSEVCAVRARKYSRSPLGNAIVATKAGVRGASSCSTRWSEYSNRAVQSVSTWRLPVSQDRARVAACLVDGLVTTCKRLVNEPAKEDQVAKATKRSQGAGRRGADGPPPKHAGEILVVAQSTAEVGDEISFWENNDTSRRTRTGDLPYDPKQTYVGLHRPLRFLVPRGLAGESGSHPDVPHRRRRCLGSSYPQAGSAATRRRPAGVRRSGPARPGCPRWPPALRLRTLRTCSSASCVAWFAEGR